MPYKYKTKLKFLSQLHTDYEDSVRDYIGHCVSKEVLVDFDAGVIYHNAKFAPVNYGKIVGYCEALLDFG